VARDESESVSQAVAQSHSVSETPNCFHPETGQFIFASRERPARGVEDFDAVQDPVGVVAALAAAAKRHRATPAQIALAWLLAQAKVSASEASTQPRRPTETSEIFYKPHI